MKINKNSMSIILVEYKKRLLAKANGLFQDVDSS